MSYEPEGLLGLAHGSRLIAHSFVKVYRMGLESALHQSG